MHGETNSPTIKRAFYAFNNRQIPIQSALLARGPLYETLNGPISSLQKLSFPGSLPVCKNVFIFAYPHLFCGAFEVCYSAVSAQRSIVVTISLDRKGELTPVPSIVSNCALSKMLAPFCPLVCSLVACFRAAYSATYFMMGVTGSSVLLTKRMGFLVFPPKGPIQESLTEKLR